jgi:hypothetical protein
LNRVRFLNPPDDADGEREGAMQRRRSAIVYLSIVGGLIGAANAWAEGVIDPRAHAALERMCDYVGGLKSFRVDTTTIDEKVTTAGQKIQEIKESKVTVQRPNRLAVDRIGPAGRVLFRYDGKQLAVYGVDKNVYAAAPAPATLDKAIDEARDRFGIDAPGGDLVVSDAYSALLDGVTEGRYIGLEPIGSVMAHHLAVKKGNVDYQLWIEDGPEPLPLRYVITSNDLPGHPQFTLELHDWRVSVPLSTSSFAFIPPPGVQRVAFAAPQRQQGGSQ